jgi:hypothetical protein
MAMASQKALLLIGGSGNLGWIILVLNTKFKFIHQLGRAIVQAFRDNWTVFNIDVNKNEDSHFNFLLPNNSPKEYLPSLYDQLEKSSSSKYDSIMCVAGGWVGGSIKEPEIFSKLEQMQKVNIIPTLLGNYFYSLGKK